jgi:CBS domain-containing protein
MRIDEIMTPKMESIEPDDTIMEAACMMRDLNIGSLTVMDGGELVGVITDRDICCRAVSEGKTPSTTMVRHIMSTDVAYCFGDQDIADAAHAMEDKHVRRLAVLDRDKHAVGFVSVDDLARYSHDLAGEVLEAATLAH